MIKFLPIILICSTDIGTFRCNEDNAINKIEVEPQNSPISCLVEGHTKAASLAFVPKENEPFYIRIKCVPKEY